MRPHNLMRFAPPVPQGVEITHMGENGPVWSDGVAREQVGYEPWRPMQNSQDLRTLGKLLEELGECSAACGRCLVQGIGESEPVTGKPNKQWLEEEIADVMANLELVSARFNLDVNAIAKRVSKKLPLLHQWQNEVLP